MKRISAAAVVAAITAALAGCAGAAGTAPVARGSDAPEVVSHEGVAEVRFGDARSELERDHGLTHGTGDCAPRLSEHPNVSPVFDDGRLVLLWVDPPLRTPAGIAVGTPVSAVHRAHPEAEPLRAPPATLRFDGLLVAEADRAYLFLHDGTEVQKVVVGFAEPARRLFHQGFGTC